MEYGCIGEKLGHSYSVEIHRLLADYNYCLKEIPKDRIDAFLTERNFRGINVTIPYKQTVIPYLSEISEEAAKIGAVNTILNRDGKLYGYNTDFIGMSRLCQKAGISLAGKTVAILGSGGTAKTARAVAQNGQASRILTVSRHPKDGEISYETLDEMRSQIEIFLNTTPVGMFPNENASPVDLSRFPAVVGVLDAVYHPLTTDLIRSATDRGIPAAGGLYMLVAQAAAAAELFTGKTGLTQQTDRVYRRILMQKQNLVLIGMPGSGKTTLGLQLARRLGLSFTDSDRMFEEKFGSIPDYLRCCGEADFRQKESAVLAEAAAQSGTVLATGGGAVLNPENIRLLRRNGFLIFLDRTPEEIGVLPGRPLTATPKAMAEKYRQRLPLYRQAADLILRPENGVLPTLNRLIAELESAGRVEEKRETL